ncbi:MAG: hypothetical protein HUK20_05465 [Fibrobacter sp.]|nr:hypothetical protein [Bacilli bacterium]MCF0223698.1 hypothetical protein [Fibrobacter sp.]
MEIEFDALLPNYCGRFEDVLKRIYPTNTCGPKGKGFNEVNQTLNFCNAYEWVYKYGVYWLEAPIDQEGKKQRADGLILDEMEGVAILIESKREVTNKSLQTLQAQWERIGKPESFAQALKYAKNFSKIKHYYRVVLLDAWVGYCLGDALIEAINNRRFKNGTFFDGDPEFLLKEIPEIEFEPGTVPEDVANLYKYQLIIGYEYLGDDFAQKVADARKKII